KRLNFGVVPNTSPYFKQLTNLNKGNINYLSDAATFNVFDACVASGGRDSSKDQLDPFGKL
ncbi:hypothetical protein NQ317_004703, partial [Molorchus minor]